MPTFGKLVGAVLFGALAWYVSGLIVPLFPEGTRLGLFREVNTFFGMLCGWKVAGPRAGTGYIASLSYGLTTLVAMVVLALGFNSSAVMVEQSLDKRYDGPGEAVTDVFAMFMEYGMLMMTPQVVGTLVVGSLVAGVVVEFFGRRLS
ncbi:MAG: TrgA family protein [Octadecabacter sp.]|nr:TrgA family protein [Octadecabacter sp.]